MMRTVIDFILEFLNRGILFYAIAIFVCYVTLAIIAIIEMRFYMKKNSFIDYRSILSSSVAPGISLIAPAYNEGMTIIENVRSLLSLHYGNFEVIIVNDGSKDDSIEKLIASYNLVPVDMAVNLVLQTKPIKVIYKSQNPAFSKLIVVDKVNGGKADALNVGINISTKKLVACIDVDCILEEDSLLKMAKPFMEETDKKVIATGGVIRIANSCIVEDGKIVKVVLPEQRLPRIQVLEYIRAFLLGRMAWSRLNALLLISGAFGLFDRSIAIKAGGYDHKTVGEDMELVMRMRRYMHEQNLKYKVAFIPDPLCWTEAPSDMKILGRQRNRWARGTFETLWIHRKMFFNPKYGIIGMLSYPYWFFFEWLAPFVEASGLIYTLILAFFGLISWTYFIALLLTVFTFSAMFSIAAVLVEERTYHQYKGKTDMLKLVWVGITEPFLYHPFVVWWALKGNYLLLKGESGWGAMTRTGFSQQKKK